MWCDLSYHRFIHAIYMRKCKSERDARCEKAQYSTTRHGAARGGRCATPRHAAPNQQFPRCDRDAASYHFVSFLIVYICIMSTEVRLIQEIKKHECLYNYSLPDYNRKDLLDVKWSEIAQKLDLPGNETRWLL